MTIGVRLDLSRISKVAQIHFVDDDDEVVPIIIAQKYLQKLTDKNCSKITQVKKVSHLEGWKVRWKELLEEKFGNYTLIHKKTRCHPEFVEG